MLLLSNFTFLENFWSLLQHIHTTIFVICLLCLLHGSGFDHVGKASSILVLQAERVCG